MGGCMTDILMPPESFIFPNNPAVGDTVVTADGRVFMWNGTTWAVIATGGLVRHEHKETPASTDWIIVHNMHATFVHVQVVDTSGNTVIPDVRFINANRVDLVFANPVSGTAILRR